MRSKSPSLLFFNSAPRTPCSAFSPTPLLILALIGLLFALSGCQGENKTSPPRLPAGVTNLSKTAALSIAPDIAASGSGIYVVWQEHVDGQNMDVFLSRSGDGGATFDAPINISESSIFSGNPKIAVSGNFVYIVWEESASTDTAENNDFDIFYRRGQDENGTFTWYPPLNEPGLRLSDPNPNCRNNSDPSGGAPCPSQTPAVVASGSNVFIAWSESTIYQFRVNNTISPPAKEFQFINSEILMVRSTDGGVVFDPTPLILSGPKDESTPSPSLNPALAAAAGRVYIAWEDIPLPQPLPHQSKILFRKLVDPLNLTVSPPLSVQAAVLSGLIKQSSRPSLAAEGSRVYLAWEGALPEGGCPAVEGNTPLTTHEILLIQSEDEGAQFSDPNDCAESNLSATDGNSNSARIAVSEPTVYLSWMDNTPGLAGILFRKSEDSGGTFSAPSKIVEEEGSTANPSTAAVNGILFAAWEDATLGNLEIVFSQR